MGEPQLSHKPKWRPRWEVTFWRAIFILVTLGGLGLHRLYMGQWKAALVLFGLSLSSIFIEVFLIWPNQALNYGQKEDVVLLINVIFWLILTRELFLVRHFTDKYNKTETYPSELFE